MVIKYFTFTVDDNFLNTCPGSPPDFAPSPEASPRACIGCIGVISRFDVLQLGDGSRDEGPGEEMQGENPGGRNGSAGIVDRIAGRQFLKQRVVLKVSMNASSSRFYCFWSQSSRCKAMRFATRCKAMRVATGFEGVQSVALVGDDKDRLEVIGERVDPIELTTLLRKNVGSVDIVTVSVVDAKDKKESESKDKAAQPIMWSYVGGVPHREIAYVVDPYPCYTQPSCSIM